MSEGPKIFFRCTAKFKQDFKVVVAQRGTTAQDVLQTFAERYLLDPLALDRALSQSGPDVESKGLRLTDTETKVVEFLRAAGTGDLSEVELSVKRTILDNLRALKWI